MATPKIHAGPDHRGKIRALAFDQERVIAEVGVKELEILQNALGEPWTERARNVSPCSKNAVIKRAS
jgi:hypothetical protein